MVFDRLLYRKKKNFMVKVPGGSWIRSLYTEYLRSTYFCPCTVQYSTENVDADLADKSLTETTPHRRRRLLFYTDIL